MLLHLVIVLATPEALSVKSKLYIGPIRKVSICQIRHRIHWVHSTGMLQILHTNMGTAETADFLGSGERK